MRKDYAPLLVIGIEHLNFADSDNSHCSNCSGIEVYCYCYYFPLAVFDVESSFGIYVATVSVHVTVVGSNSPDFVALNSSFGSLAESSKMAVVVDVVHPIEVFSIRKDHDDQDSDPSSDLLSEPNSFERPFLAKSECSMHLQYMVTRDSSSCW